MDIGDQVTPGTADVENLLALARNRRQDDILEIFVKTRRNAKAAKRFLQRLLARFGAPRVVIPKQIEQLRQGDYQVVFDGCKFAARVCSSSQIDGAFVPMLKCIGPVLAKGQRSPLLAGCPHLVCS